MEEFDKYGTVADCYIPKDHNTGQSRSLTSSASTPRRRPTPR